MAVALLATLYGALLGNLVAAADRAPPAPPAREEAFERARLVAPLAALAAREAPRAPAVAGMTLDDPLSPAPGKPLWLMTLADLALLLVGFLVLVQATDRPQPRSRVACATASARRRGRRRCRSPPPRHRLRPRLGRAGRRRRR